MRRREKEQALDRTHSPFITSPWEHALLVSGQCPVQPTLEEDFLKARVLEAGVTVGHPGGYLVTRTRTTRHGCGQVSIRWDLSPNI